MSADDLFQKATIIATPKGRFPALNNRLSQELGKYFDRQNEAIAEVLNTARSKTEFLETLAKKAKQDLEADKYEIEKSLGRVSE